jgi:uncharacterized membrane protein
VGDFSPAAVRLLGTVELAGALGLILPAATGIALALTPLSATGLVVLMVHVSPEHHHLLPLNLAKE